MEKNTFYWTLLKACIERQKNLLVHGLGDSA